MRPVILYPPTIDWDQLHQRPQQLLKALAAAGASCVFCNLNLHNRHPAGFEEVSPGLLLANGLPFPSVLTWVRRQYPASPLVLYYTYPPQSSHISSLDRDLLIFDSVDAPSNEFSQWLWGYDLALTSCDFALASSASLQKRATALAERPVHLLPNGCDFAHFRQAAVHKTLPEPVFRSGRPVVGYVGAIAPWLDWSLLNRMAHFLPEYEFIFIGAPLLQPGVAFANANMHYLGHRDYSLLPAYLSNFTYCLIPFLITEMTNSVNPVKFWEYLASGKQVWSTALPEIPAGYAAIISKELFPGFSPGDGGKTQAERLALAEANSWTVRAKRLLELIEDALAKG